MRICLLASLALGLALFAPASAQPAADVPVTRVILFTSGFGYFEHGGTVAGDADLALTFEETALNDVLKSLLVEDRGGRVAGVVYPSQAPLEHTLGSFALDFSGAPDLPALLQQARGAEVVVSGPGLSERGVIAAVGTRPGAEHATLTLRTSRGLTQLSFERIESVSFSDPAMQAELDGALAALGEASGSSRRTVRVQFRGSRARPVRLGYVVESPVWKTSYRLVLGADGAGTLQGWALVENPTETDWTGVDLTLVSGRPVSFVQDLYTPRYVERPVVVAADDAAVRPRTYAEGAEAERLIGATPARYGDTSSGWRMAVGVGGSAGTVSGLVVDAATGQTLPGASIRLTGTTLGAATGLDGRFRISGVPPGTYTVVVSFAGYGSASQAVGVSDQQGATLQVWLASASLGEVEVVSERPLIQRDAIGTPRVGGASPPAVTPAPAPPVDPTAGVEARARAGDFGEMFAYRLGDVTLPRRGSAMLPIVQEGVVAERLSIYSGEAGRHPMRAVRLRNTTGAALRAGPETVLDDGYAGDALLPDLPAGTERILAYAVEQDVLVDPVARPDATGTVQQATLVDGVLTLRRERTTHAAYRIHNRGTRERTVVVEVPRVPGARLDSPATAETTPTHVRPRLVVGPGRADTLVVRQSRLTSESVYLTSEQPEQILFFASADGAIPASIRAALRRAVDSRRSLAETERDIQRLQAERQQITSDQHRVRENLRSVDAASAYGRRLLERLDTQENRLDAIERELGALEQRAAEQRQALAVTVR